MRTFKNRLSVNTENGFTIIETLIVLGIAGLILLIVLQALPVLNRNSRNNQRRQDVQAILEAASHFELNNSGNLPGPPPDNPFLQYATLTYYDKTSVKYVPVPDSATANGINVHVYGVWTASPKSNTGSTNLDTVDIYNYQKCDPNSSSPGGSIRKGAGYNDVVALYAIETGTSSTGAVCEQI